MIDGTGGEIEHRHRGGSPHRWSRGDDEGVCGEDHNGRTGGSPATDTHDEEKERGGGRKNGDVAARDRDHVVGAGRLQRLAHLVW